MSKKELLGLSYDELAFELAALKQPAFRAKQLFDWLHNKRIMSLSEAHNVPKNLKEILSEHFEFSQPEIVATQESADGTAKYLLRYPDGNAVEAVVMSYREWDSICISTQFGCRMGCKFCASTPVGFVRNMTVGELLFQVYTIANLRKAPMRRLVLMGVGEPLDNYENVIKFLRLLGDERGYNISMRHISLSTCGLVPAIEKLCEENIPLTLSISLHRTTDDERTKVMPINNAYPIAQLMRASLFYAEKTGRRVSYEYAVSAGENDTSEDIYRLSKMLKGTGSHINIIPLNAIDGDDEERRKKGLSVANDFCDRLNKEGLSATVRRTLGTDIDAACGQLRRKHI